MHNIAIYEGNKAARMQGVSLITTDDGNDGRVTWVPQDDRKTGTLHVSENGTYRAEDEGLHSWSKVTVRLAGAPAGMTIPTLPDPIKQIEIATGEVGEVDPVAPAGWEPLDDIEPISLEEAEKIIEGELDEDSQDYEDAIQEIADRLGTDPENVKIVDPDDPSTVKEAEPKPEGKGQQITGVDAETGIDETIGIAGDGTAIDDKPIVGMILARAPNKRAYRDTEKIDYSGMVIGLVDSSGRIRKRVYWPDDDINTSVTEADVDAARSIEAEYGEYTIPLTTRAIVEHSGNYGRGTDYIYTFPTNTACILSTDRSFRILMASKTAIYAPITRVSMPWKRKADGEKEYTGTDKSSEEGTRLSLTYSYNGKISYYATKLYSYSAGSTKIGINGGVDLSSLGVSEGMLAWMIAHSERKRGIQEIPVSYGDYAGDSFDIIVTREDK